jgi:exodeoxyribonuclease VII small subunit
MLKSEPKLVEAMNYEEAFAELEKIVAGMEAGEGELDASLEAFVRGQSLIRRCAELLDSAELKVHQLSGDTLEDLPADE